ncbi:MAG: Serine/threonine protein kinase, partial [Cyanobacteria bacterium RYN_339]|nr:Serine/threonine protein kinase [Cyanobacteria bacterium RYN_339]
MGQVHLVFDREREEEVALKAYTSSGEAEEGRFLFKQEFWAMASLRHPNLVAAYDYGELADGTPYFTMEVVPGSDLEPTQDEAAVRGWLPGIAAALGYLHGQGFVHGDLKPENVRLGEVPKLMDLGLLTRAGRAGGPIRGSLLYLAPEVARQAALDGRADLYALGAVVYHVLAGRPVFEGESAVSLLRAHLDAPPVPLRQHAPAVSRELEAAVLRLLAKDPAERYASAGDLMEALGLHVEGVEAHNLLGSPLFGREDIQGEIGTLLRSESGGTRWIVGGSGSGKSRLLQESRATAQLEGLPTFYAQGLGRETAPYTALRPWLKAITGQPTPARERLAPVLVRLLPELGVDPAPPLDGAQERMRLHNAIAELARAVAPSAVWLLDNADELDTASRELLTFLQGQSAGAAWRWILTSQIAGEGTRILPLAPLDEATTLRMARALLGQEALPEGLAERLLVITGGLPGAVEAVLGHWVRAGALRRERGTWVGGDDALFELPGGWQVALDARFEELPEGAKRVGRVAALLGAQADLPWLAALVELPSPAFFAALAQLEAAEVLAREDSQFRFVRPAQVAVLTAAFTDDERRGLHTAAATWLAERLGAPADSPALPLADIMAVARHHLAGNTPALGVPYLVAAGQRSLAMYVTAGLDGLLRRALVVDGLAEEHRLALRMVLGTVQRFDGKIDDAMALYEEELLPALRAGSHEALAHELVTWGVILQMKGKYPRALEAFAEAINLADAAGDVEAGIRARVFAGRVGFFAGETGASRTHLASAVRRAREAGAA